MNYIEVESVKIEVQNPFNYKRGYLRTTKSGRKLVDLVNSNKDRTTISYARYLMCVKVGYIISSDLEVDHIDGDRTNDELSNLQILSKESHRKKTALSKTRSVTTLICPQCGKEFERFTNLIKKGSNPKCSRRCNALYNRSNCGWGK
ncbi:HNH endonuclease signature motif containing protein (plasmid) [Acinetobacter baumannii]